MTASRVGHSAILLPNGKVLIAGGASGLSPNGNYSFVASEAEVYDPSIGTFTSIGNLDDGDYRSGNGDYMPSTTLLADGRVLIVGASAHLYDPVTGGLSDRINDNALGLYFNQKG